MCSSILVQNFVLILAGLSGGVVVAGGVFTVFTAVGLVPRFADRIKGGGYVLLYEDMIVLGVIAGILFSVYAQDMRACFDFIRLSAVKMGETIERIVCACEYGIVILYALLTGCYVGCLALSIAEILDALPIMARRANLKRGVGIVILSFALGKLIGSLFYYRFHF